MTKESPLVIGLTYFATYLGFSWGLFGSIFKPIASLFMWEFIRIPNYLLLISLSIGVITGLLIYFILKKFNWIRAYKFLLALLSFSVVSIFVAAAISNHVRVQKITELAPDKIETNSFIKSLHNSPDGFHYTHAVAVKKCKHYAWSYSELDFYELPNSIARNVVPIDWFDDCNKALSQS